MKTVPATITLAAALVAAIATPIAASPAWAKYRHPNLAGPPNGYNVPYIYPPDRGPHSPPASDVYSTRGRYIGSDPDPFIRGQLARDPAQND